MLIFLTCTIVGQCSINDNAVTLDRRACSFGSYAIFKLKVNRALEKLGCHTEGTTCDDCSLSSLGDCGLFGTLAEYTEEAGDPAFQSIQTALAACVDPNLGNVNASGVVNAIKTSPDILCGRVGSVSSDVVTAMTVLVAVSTSLFAWQISQEKKRYGQYQALKDDSNYLSVSAGGPFQ